VRRSSRPPKSDQNILVKPALDGQILPYGRAGRQIGADPLGVGDDRRQARDRPAVLVISIDAFG